MAFWVVGPGSASGTWSDSPHRQHESVAIAGLAYLVIHEERPDDPMPQYQSRSHDYSPTEPDQDTTHCCALMESTESGVPITSAPASSLASYEERDKREGRIIGDLEAASVVRDHVIASQRRNANSKHARILRALINPRYGSSLTAGMSGGQITNDLFPLDDDALQSLFSAANELFFANKLSRRVSWDWSDPSSPQFENEIVGTTALRRCRDFNGWETLMVLSSPVLRDPQYNRHLLIATFLHEMIHSFLYVMCGLKASNGGGHTEGFRQIAQILDDWIGQQYLRLGDMKADLDYFRIDNTPARSRVAAMVNYSSQTSIPLSITGF
ncbi:hypothetical protein VHEMI04877 [[Torrubiella] hemipterigena]|uniref:SprT-like domain-containing protein n=1 Tax=[Torrubiella] hemipterigena TaxID=1531966 RepID=A0A0A1SWG0_9HYPO|nr:hypothetical protein VHEMI04877 [[Torrubiella] hemipterigena]